MFLFSKFGPDRGGVRCIVVGLGNPGKKYQGTRHNCGFAALDHLAATLGVKINRSRFQSLCCRAECGGVPVLLMKPTTFMNLSGAAVGEAAKFYKLRAENVIVLCDDISLPCGKLRVRASGSAGGHNGLKSIISCLGSDGFARVKIGVGSEHELTNALADYVLSRPSSAQRQLIESRFDDIDDAVELIAAGNLAEAQARHN